MKYYQTVAGFRKTSPDLQQKHSASGKDNSIAPGRRLASDRAGHEACDKTINGLIEMYSVGRQNLFFFVFLIMFLFVGQEFLSHIHEGKLFDRRNLSDDIRIQVQ